MKSNSYTNISLLYITCVQIPQIINFVSFLSPASPYIQNHFRMNMFVTWQSYEVCVGELKIQHCEQ